MESLTGTEGGRRVSLYKLVGYGFGVVFLVFFGLLILGGASQAVLLQLFVALVVVNAVLAGGLAKVAGAHWSSAVAAGAFGWLTSLFPLLAAGWFAGYVELRYISVNISDIATLNEILNDQESPVMDLVSRMRAVPLFRLILVVALTNVGSAIASYVVFPVLIPYISSDIGGMQGVSRLLWQGVREGTQILVGVL
jgi:pheromone shutdown protein TraB